MISRFDPGADRERLGFVEAVLEYFEPLLRDHGFRVTDRKTTMVTFESDDVCLRVYHGRGSFELDVEIGLRPAEADQATFFRSAEIRHAARARAGDPTSAPWQASTPESLREGVRRLAAFLQAYGAGALRGDPSSFEALAASSEVLAAATTTGYAESDLRSAAERAWHARDLPAVITAYEELDRLSPDAMRATDVKRLEYARRHLAR